MNKFALYFTVFFGFFVSGCSTHITMTGKQYPPTDPLSVKILFKEKPACNFEELGFISTPLSWNQNEAVKAARYSAASVGADYLVIETVQTNIYNDSRVSAVAYKCSNVDREAVQVKPQ